MSSIITLQELKTYAGQDVVTDNARAQQVVDATNASIENRTGRLWGETATGTEVHDFASVIFLRNMDVLAVTELKHHGRVRPATAYRFSDTGRVVLSREEANFEPRYGEIEVTYTYGNPVVPDDLKQAALSAALDAYSYVSDGQQQEVTEEQIGSLRYKYASGSSSSVGKGYADTIARYRRINV